ncbi:hypothetical protein GCK32_008903 [Trichostrongylus colubriformis]|uniref:Uncharacterized protein n=1 Tax=Trichostrongylus colubriformis TaxID=6319 RepID=A0AAN8IH93_TRICO
MKKYLAVMTEAPGATKICTYMYSVSCSIIAEILMIFGYRNNAWLVLYNDDHELQRGLNDDCLKTDTIRCHSWCFYQNDSATFPGLFTVKTPPSLTMYLALYTARSLFILQLAWFIMCVTCCCNLKAEKFAKKHQQSVLQFCGLEAILFMVLLILMVVAFCVDDIMDILPNGYHRTFGSGFWLFIAGGTPLYLLSVFLHSSLELRQAAASQGLCIAVGRLLRVCIHCGLSRHID